MSLKIRDKDNKVYVVLGAWQSATSFIAKALNDQGVDMLVTEKNLYQNRSLMRRNMAILSRAGGHWKHPPSEKEIEKVKESIAKQFIDDHKHKKMWGFKDPRLALTAKKFFPYLEGDVYLICCFRKPEKIVKSSADMEPEFTRNLVDEYNRRIISSIREFVGL